MKIGFIGTGVMGFSMVKNLLKENYAVKVYNRTTAKAAALVKDNAVLTTSVAKCIEDVDIVITMVGYPKDVANIYKEIFKYAKENTILIDMTTSSPSLAVEIYNKAKAKNLFALDAPVSGGDIGAKKGELTIMVGGDEEIYNKVLPIFKAMGKTINLIGPCGSGQHCKMANQIAIAGSIVGTMEALAYTKSLNLDMHQVYSAIAKGSAQSFQLDYCFNKVLNDDYKPGFYIKHFIKDMQLAKIEANRKKLLLPVLNQVLKQFKKLQKLGYGDLGTQALFKYYMES